MSSAGRILFVENREKTFLWAAVARRLMARGVTVEWLVQNPLFSPPAAGRIHRLPFPRADDRTEERPPPHGVLETDRGRQYFAAGTRHYAHYARAVERSVRAAAPDLVIGESTLIQELLAIPAARRAGAIFLHPASDRYPDDRFSLMIEDSQLTFGGSGESMPSNIRRDLAERISSGRRMPAYMAPRSPFQRRWQALRWAVTRTRVVAAWAMGERYNTPSPIRKAEIGRQARANAAAWDRMARGVGPDERALLYAMQVQPEASIDVWGRPWVDQPDIVRRMLAAAPPDMRVAVKANPRPRYDLSDELIAMIAGDPRLIALPRDLSMSEAQATTIGCVTVCGTVGLEAVFGRGRCMSLKHPMVDRLFPHCAAATPEEAVERLLTDPAAGRGSVEEGERLLDHVMRHSYPGVISDPVSDPRCMTPENIVRLADAIADGLARRRAGEPLERVA